MVLGLHRGGSRRGWAFRVAPAEAEAVLGDLDKREIVSRVYHRRVVSVEIGDRRLRAHAYIPNRDGGQYAGKLPPDRIVELVLQGEGSEGRALAYLETTVRHLDELGIPDESLHRLLDEARRRRGIRSRAPQG